MYSAITKTRNGYSIDGCKINTGDTVIVNETQTEARIDEYGTLYLEKLIDGVMFDVAPEQFCKPIFYLRPLLKKCPMCGSTVAPKVISNYEMVGMEEEIASVSYTVCCSINNGGCGTCSGYRFTKEETIRLWNTRYNT